MDAASSHPDGTAWARAVRLAWRRLTGGPDAPDESRPTLVAISGGTDSAALAIALASVDRARVGLVYLAHGLRPAEFVADDIEAVRGLAATLRRPVVIESVRVPEVGNAEANARGARYTALHRLAESAGYRFVATGHHALDQWETMIGAVLRGGSAGAIAGIRPQRPLGPSVDLIRPALEQLPQASREVCRSIGYRPRTDHTNADPARLRGAMRTKTLHDLAKGVDGLGARLARTAELMASIANTQPPREERSAKNERTSSSSRSSSETCDTL
ncbi:MAG: tRNA lysidine(34) synthetase TilS [Phycisphaerales bacterium]